MDIIQFYPLQIFLINFSSVWIWFWKIDTLATTIIDMIFVCTLRISLLLTLINLCTILVLFFVLSCLCLLFKFFCHNTLKLRLSFRFEQQQPVSLLHLSLVILLLKICFNYVLSKSKRTGIQRRNSVSWKIIDSKERQN